MNIFKQAGQVRVRLSYLMSRLFYSRAAASLGLLFVGFLVGKTFFCFLFANKATKAIFGFFDHVNFKFGMPSNYLSSFGQFEKVTYNFNI